MNLRTVLLPANLILLALVLYTVKGIVLAPETRPEAADAAIRKAAPAPEAVAAAPERQKPAARPATDYAVIVARDIFGAADTSAAKDEPGEQSLAGVPQAKLLELKLLGTIAGDADIARAIIQDSRAKTQGLFRRGDEIQGATVSQILRNKVILLNGGREEVLELSVESQEPSASPEPAAPASALAQAADPATAVKVVSPTRREIDKAAFLAKAGGIEALATAATVQPYVVDGQMKGVQLTGLENVTVAKALGLENGDVVKNVNGQDLTSLQKAFQVMRKARGQPSVDVQLLRGNEERKLAFGVK